MNVNFEKAKQTASAKLNKAVETKNQLAEKLGAGLREGREAVESFAKDKIQKYTSLKNGSDEKNTPVDTNKMLEDVAKVSAAVDAFKQEKEVEKQAQIDQVFEDVRKMANLHQFYVDNFGPENVSVQVSFARVCDIYQKAGEPTRLENLQETFLSKSQKRAKRIERNHCNNMAEQVKGIASQYFMNADELKTAQEKLADIFAKEPNLALAEKIAPELRNISENILKMQGR